MRVSATYQLKLPDCLHVGLISALYQRIGVLIVEQQLAISKSQKYKVGKYFSFPLHCTLFGHSYLIHFLQLF